MSLPTNSRMKGKRGELDAAAHLTELTRWKWERTAQRWGKATADVWCPRAPALFQLHVEVKLYGRGLAKLHTAAAAHPLVVTRDGLHICELSRLRVQLLRLGAPDVTLSVHNTTAAFMRQAVADASGVTPLVLMRQDRHPWLAVWRSEDEDRVAYQLDQVWHEA